MTREWLPGLGPDADITSFENPRRLYVAKWWMRPICWLLRRPTEYWA